MRFDINRGLSKKILQSSIKHYKSPVDTAFHINKTLEELLQTLRTKKSKFAHDVYYFYAVDDNNRLYGVLSTRDILFNPLNTRLIEIVDEDIFTLHENVSVEHALKVLTDHQYLSVPIVDDEYHLIGLFEIKPVGINFSRRFKKRPVKETQDVFQIIGFTIEKSKLDSKWAEYRYRMPWLVGNLFAGFVCAAIAAYYHTTLTTVIVIPMFIPLVLTLAESISMQSMTISLQLLHYKKIPWKDIGLRITHEWLVAGFLGCTSALVLMVYYMIGYDKDWIPDLSMIAIASSIIVSMIIAASFGTLFPLILHKFELDPKLAAGPVALMMTDIMTTAIYFGLATWMLL
jgi:magnesium transporter